MAVISQTFGMISIKAHSGIYTLETKQELHIGLEEAWEFFSTPENLGKITPDYMGFHITSQVGSKMYPGQIITYNIGILPGIKSNWVTEITHVLDKVFFVDEQRFGPYAMWHHEHLFEQIENGVLMTDRISYKLPLGVLGRIAQPFIKMQLMKIFTFRQKALENIFSKNNL